MMVADGYPKLAAMILEESYLNNQLGDLLDHPCPKEICVQMEAATKSIHLDTR